MSGIRLSHVCILALLVFLASCGENAECSTDGDCDFSIGEYCSSSGTCICNWLEGRTATFYVNESCSSDLTPDSCLAAVQSAIDYWNAPGCSDLLFVFGGTTTRHDVGYDSSGTDNINLLIWRESNWQTDDCPEPEKACRDPRSIGLATTTYETYTGQILDIDIELNGEGFQFSESDLEDYLKEEFGHAINVMDLDMLCARFPSGEPCPCADEVVR